MRNLVWVGMVLVSLLSGCSAESEIRKKVDFACRHVSLQSPTLIGLPEGAKAEQVLRKEDLQFLQDKERSDDAGFAAAMKVALLPAMRAIAEARAVVTTCEMTGLTQTEGRATVTVKETTPKPPAENLAGSLERLGEISKLDTHAARVAKAKEWFAQSTDKVVIEHSVTVLKTESGWRVDLQLPEKAKEVADRKSREAMVEKLLKGAFEVLQDCDLARARARVDEAEKLMPGAPALATARETIEERATGCIGGKWYRTSKKDPMTDDMNVTVILSSENELAGSYKSSKAALVGRCVETRLELYISTDLHLDDTFQVGVEGRYRFGTVKAERIVFTRSTDGNAAFFRNTGVWLTTLGAKKDEVLAVELPVYGKLAAVAQFNLAGADKAIAELISACGR